MGAVFLCVDYNIHVVDPHHGRLVSMGSWLPMLIKEQFLPLSAEGELAWAALPGRLGELLSIYLYTLNQFVWVALAMRF